MKEKKTDATSQRLEGDRSIDASLVNIDLPLFIEQIKQESSWESNKRNAVTVFKTNSLTIVLIALQEGIEITRHTAKGVISVQVLEGLVKFSTDQQSVDLGRGQMLALHERIPHSVLAVKESIFLLTLATSI